MDGVMVMQHHLTGNEETVAAYQAALNKTISSLSVGDELFIGFTDGTGLIARDDGQTCCESRYMVTDDDLAPFVGASFLGAELREAPNEPDDYGEHEVQFLVINTSRGSFTVATHNEHNGYYGGFAIVLRAA